MMMGHGHGSGGSNLSASAPPFTVDRSASKPLSHPLLDLIDPPPYAAAMNPSSHNWANSYSPHPNSTPDFFSTSSNEFDSSSAYTYSASVAHVSPSKPVASASPDALFYAPSSISLVEAKPYYPSYVSPTTGSDCPSLVSQHSGYDMLAASSAATAANVSFHANDPEGLSGLGNTTQWCGFWDGLSNRQENKLPKLDQSLYSEEKYTNPGCYASKAVSKYERPSGGIDALGGEMHVEPEIPKQFDHMPFVYENLKFMPSDRPTVSTLASASVVPETHLWVSSSKAVNSWNHQMPYGVTYDKCPRKCVTAPTSTSARKTSPAVVITPPKQDAGLFKLFNSGKDGDKDFTAEHLSALKEPQTCISSGMKAHFSTSQLGFHLQQSDHILKDFSLTSSEELPRNKSVDRDLLGHGFLEKAEILVPPTNLDCLSVVIDNNGANNSGENNSESDHCNPAVDSPCWKGAPVSHACPFEFSRVATLQDVKRLEACNGSNLIDHESFPLTANDSVTVSAEKQNEYPMLHDDHCLENNLAPSLNRPSVASGLFREENVVKSRTHHIKPSYGHQVSNGNHEASKENAFSGKSLNRSGLQKKCASGIGISDVGMNTSDDPDECSSHVPFHAIEHVLSSPPSVEDAPTQLLSSPGEEALLRMYGKTLVNTVHNVSELLLFHCSNVACELREEDCDVLKGVINNLNACILKNGERTASKKDSPIPQIETSKYLGKLSKLQKGKEEYSKEDSNLSNIFSRDAADVVIDDGMTQAIKKILIKNFQDEEETQPLVLLYKNLWLEAEASLFSINYVARINRVKNEMARFKLQKSKVSPGSSTSVEGISCSKISSDRFTANELTGYDHGMEDILNSKVSYGTSSDNAQTYYDKGLEVISSLKISSNIFTGKAPTAHDKGGTAPCISIPGSTSGSISHADPLARFHTLKSRVDLCNSLDNSTIEKPKVSTTGNKVDELTPELKDGTDLGISNNTTHPSSSHKDDVETSVMARFHILKQRNDCPGSPDAGEKLLDVDHGYPAQRKPIWKDGLKDKFLAFDVEPVAQDHASNSAKDEAFQKEFHLFGKEDIITNSRMTNCSGDQLHSGWYDSSSDWEHVLKEELV